MPKLIQPKITTPTRIVVQGRLCYVHLWEAHAAPQTDNYKYSVAVLIPKTDTDTVKAVKDAIEAAFAEGIKSKQGWKGLRPKKGTPNPLKDGDDPEMTEDYRGCWVFNASSKSRVPVLGRDRMPITNQEEVYSGCWGLVSVNFFPYDTAGNKGVSCGLNAVLKTADDKPLAARDSAKDFEGMLPEEDEGLDDM